MLDEMIEQASVDTLNTGWRYVIDVISSTVTEVLGNYIKPTTKRLVKDSQRAADEKDVARSHMFAAANGKTGGDSGS